MRRVLTPALLASVVFIGGLDTQHAAASEPALARGEYLSKIMDCTGCHTQGMLAGNPDPNLYLAGSDIGFEIPGLGIFYPPNLTPDKETGLGSWSSDEIVAAVRTGVRPDGRELAPAMPWHAYSALNDDEAAVRRPLTRFLRFLRGKIDPGRCPRA